MSAFVTQVAVETLGKPTNANLRVTQSATEILRRPTIAKACLSQIVVEILRPSAASSIGSSQQPLVIVIAG